MNQLFVLVILVSVLINSQNEPKPTFYKALNDNQNQIDYIINTPLKNRYDVNIYIFIRKWVWLLESKSKSIDNYRIEVMFDLAFNPSRVKELKEFYSETYTIGFCVMDWTNKDKNIIAGLSKDYKTLKYIYPPIANKTTNVGKPRQLFGSIIEKDESKPDDNSTRRRRQTTPIAVQTLKTGFDVSKFKPQLSFVRYSETGEPLVIFIETNATNGKYQSNIQAYSKPHDINGWTVSATTDPRIPISVVSAAEEYYIKGVTDIQLVDTNNNTHNGTIILIELCSKQDIPCTGNISYHYCFVEDNDTTPVADGKQCNKNKLKLLFDSNPNVETETAIPVDSQSPPIDISGQSEPSPLTESSPSTYRPESGVSNGTSGSEGSHFWIWIIILIIIFITIAVLVYLFINKSKEKTSNAPEDTSVNSSAPIPDSSESKSSSNTK